MTRNVWELYSSMPGWEGAAVKLEEALATALATADAKIAKGMHATEAAEAAFVEVLKVMDQPDVRDFGGADSEPRDTLGSKISRHMMQNHKVKMTVDRFGDVY